MAWSPTSAASSSGMDETLRNPMAARLKSDIEPCLAAAAAISAVSYTHLTLPTILRV